jgi:acetylornithine/N-succinyldiaminopimelate aminotransferase
MFSSQEEVFEKEKKYMMPVYKRPQMVIESGKGATVKDYTGKEYIDCVAGIAVNAVGYSHPVVLKALKEQAEKLMHVSNLYYTEPQVRLAEKLSEISGMAKSFFCNSGAESVEAALKLAIKATGKRKFIAAEGSFHGRTLGSLSTTFGTRLRGVFEPLLLRSVEFVRYNDATAIRDAIDADTAAVILEPIQGESGVIVPSDGYLKAVREICDAKGVLFILDEIQTGFGRTGKWFCKEHEDVEPDIMSLAKAMGAGFPIGAMLAREGIEFETSERVHLWR